MPRCLTNVFHFILFLRTCLWRTRIFSTDRVHPLCSHSPSFTLLLFLSFTFSLFLSLSLSLSVSFNGTRRSFSLALRLSNTLVVTDTQPSFNVQKKDFPRFASSSVLIYLSHSLSDGNIPSFRVQTSASRLAHACVCACIGNAGR